MPTPNDTKATNSEIKARCAEALAALLPELSAKDKKDAARKFRLRGSGIYNYLHGDIGDVDTGLNLVDFFADRVAQKKDRLNKILPGGKDNNSSVHSQAVDQN